MVDEQDGRATDESLSSQTRGEQRLRLVLDVCLEEMGVTKQGSCTRFTINMQHGSVGFYLLVLLLFHPLSLTDLEEVDEVPVEVVTNSSPCSTTCGLGVKTQTLCFLQDGKTAMEETKGGTTVTEKCRVRKVKCLESWQCGLRTMTVTSGQKVEIDCLGEVMETMGRFSWRVSWRYARGVISSDDSLFARWEAPQLDRVILNPVREEDAGTYRCDVQDAAFRRVKRIYWGIRVLPVGILNLDYESSEAQWESTGNHQSRTSGRSRSKENALALAAHQPLALQIRAAHRTPAPDDCDTSPVRFSEAPALSGTPAFSSLELPPQKPTATSTLMRRSRFMHLHG
ncbi:transmembrane protein 81 [Stegastes partitus]|uniref:Transmembrane protein 81 n=1 Tax=Stegastes partitus TaxID=144197 RepID=A0A9Y4JRW3_9TELE|nr:PREDICTED: transmembrane protein 81 [Stegastes partitus]